MKITYIVIKGITEREKKLNEFQNKVYKVWKKVKKSVSRARILLGTIKQVLF